MQNVFKKTPKRHIVLRLYIEGPVLWRGRDVDGLRRGNDSNAC